MKEREIHCSPDGYTPYPPAAPASGGDLPYSLAPPAPAPVEGRYPEGDVSANYVEGNEAWGKKSLSKLPHGLDKLLDKGREGSGGTSTVPTNALSCYIIETRESLTPLACTGWARTKVYPIH